LREHTAPEETVAVVGSEPQIYFYARRLSATGYIYTYGLMEPQPYNQAMQRQMAREIEAGRPRYLLFVNVSWSWLRRPESPGEIFDWLSDHERSYERVGVVLLSDDRPGEFVWDEAARRLVLAADGPWITILRRKD
jgi:hypothetical protein